MQKIAESDYEKLLKEYKDITGYEIDKDMTDL